MNNSQIIKQLNDLFEESIIMLPDEEVLEDIKNNPDPAFKKHFNRIKRLNAKAKAEAQKSISSKAKEMLDNLINYTGKSAFMKQLLGQPKYSQLNKQLFSKFEKITEEDKESMLEDRKFMELIKELKQDLNNEIN